MIPQRDLSILSNRLMKQGGRRIVEAVLERDYCLSWFLVGLSRSPLRGRLIFKGGTALKKCYFSEYRFSEDLDFTLAEDTPWSDIAHALVAIFAEVEQLSGVELRLDRMDRHTHDNSHTFYLAYEGPLPPARGKTIKTDITIRERLVCPIEERPVLRGYDEYRDVPEQAFIHAYSLNEIAVEKTVALFDRARTEPRDLYDLWYLTSNGHVNLTDILEPLARKLDFRNRTLQQVANVFAAKEARYRKLWEVRLAAQMSDIPQFEGVYRTVRRALRVWTNQQTR